MPKEENIVDFDPSIDEMRLDTEWQNQPMMVWKMAREKALADKMVAEAKAAMEVVRAELAREIRADPVAFELDKVTESTVPACVLEQKPFKTAQAKYIEACYNADMYKAATIALEHRKKALEGMVELQGQNYFSAPRAGKHGKEGADKIEKTASRSRMSQKEEDDDDE